jgi:hypothetical protein
MSLIRKHGVLTILDDSADDRGGKRQKIKTVRAAGAFYDSQIGPPVPALGAAQGGFGMLDGTAAQFYIDSVLRNSVMPNGMPTPRDFKDYWDISQMHTQTQKVLGTGITAGIDQTTPNDRVVNYVVPLTRNFKMPAEELANGLDKAFVAFQTEQEDKTPYNTPVHAMSIPWINRMAMQMLTMQNDRDNVKTFFMKAAIKGGLPHDLVNQIDWTKREHRSAFSLFVQLGLPATANIRQHSSDGSGRRVNAQHRGRSQVKAMVYSHESELAGAPHLLILVGHEDNKQRFKGWIRKPHSFGSATNHNGAIPIHTLQWQYVGRTHNEGGIATRHMHSVKTGPSNELNLNENHEMAYLWTAGELSDTGRIDNVDVLGEGNVPRFRSAAALKRLQQKWNNTGHIEMLINCDGDSRITPWGLYMVEVAKAVIADNKKRLQELADLRAAAEAAMESKYNAPTTGTAPMKDASERKHASTTRAAVVPAALPTTSTGGAVKKPAGGASWFPFARRSAAPEEKKTKDKDGDDTMSTDDMLLTTTAAAARADKPKSHKKKKDKKQPKETDGDAVEE